MIADRNFIARSIAGEYILVPTGEAALRLQGMITMTESGNFLWNCLQKECTEEELVEALLGEYDVERSVAEADVREFVKKMLNLGLVK